jgi:uncharacterized protein
MPVNVNLRHLEAHNVELAGQLPVEELDIEIRDEVIRLGEPLRYDLEVQQLEDGLLVRGRLNLKLDCECVRCLKPFQHELRLDEWTCHLPLQGEDAVKIMNDCVDLTPYLREDILLEFPQHPVCDAGCGGLPDRVTGKAKKTSSAGKPGEDSSAWSELNKLKF